MITYRVLRGVVSEHVPRTALVQLSIARGLPRPDGEVVDVAKNRL